MSEELLTARADGGDGRKPITAAAVAAMTGGELRGDGAIIVSAVAPLDRATSDDLSFLSHDRYASWFATTRAGVVLVSPNFADAPSDALARIIVAKPIDAMIPVLSHFHRREHRTPGIHPTAVVSPAATIADDVTIDAYAVVADDVVVGSGTWIGAHAVVGTGCRIGSNVRLHAASVLYQYVEVGDRVQIHSGARIGREGFGFVAGKSGPVRIPHVGRCVLEADVEVGANSCVDRGSVDDTIVGAGTKIDNLVQVAHNVRIGRMCFIAAQVGIAGSTRIGDGVQIGGQVGIGGHLTVGSGASLAGRSGVYGDIPAGETWSGYPARPHRAQLRAQAAMLRLGKLIRPLEQLLAKERAP